MFGQRPWEISGPDAPGCMFGAGDPVYVSRHQQCPPALLSLQCHSLPRAVCAETWVITSWERLYRQIVRTLLYLPKILLFSLD